ncbi:MAG: cytochrome C, partial [Desulfuromonadales bacterium]|nr:cytochrome C [Desulfuromonadales bacterium]
MAKKSIFVPLLAATLLSVGVNTTASASPFKVDLELFKFNPSLIVYEKSAAEFTDPQTCGECHEDKYQEWNGSLHNMAFIDPVYQGELNKANKAVGHSISRQCEGCHSPAGVVTGEIKGPGVSGLSAVARAGVSCDICHSISGLNHDKTPTKEPENGSFVIKPGEDRPDGPVLIKHGPRPPAEGCGDGFHECQQTEFHAKADICASCHQVYHYEKHFPIEATYNEWKHSPYAQQDIHCQDCHMVDTATFLKVADNLVKPERKDYRHYFNGANYLLYYLGAQAAEKVGDKEQAGRLMHQYDMAVKRLQNSAELEIEPIYRKGALAEVRVRVKNVRAGHNLPTSLTNIRQMWLEVIVKDEKGKVILATGAVAADGSLSEDARLFNSDGMGPDMHFAVDPWIITAFSRHETIPPKGYRDVHYGVTAPKGSKKLMVEAKLRYRQADQKIAEALLGAVPKDIDLARDYGLSKVPTLPVVDMVAL